ncbi:arginine/serine-rich coiled-coil protein 2 [Danio rerio]|uniref:Arginine/serine-rich coiled-coil protein 2 n=4 Tax=Danio rerio TaxID=7955 RepID=RSRC2_DANRE|nr:arginine/serine-rich coiled-coil protein 2 [Danio rerio]Q6NWI1.1 RecName: Full=Arginine/serine-rich coiled-coil protein 2 [Danio rerio]AAH67581.1 Arginine/serine-rich coiled-coil 2 [Danio rerio]|eukprot:NP_998445.1 arginine/serine-rich coiled-coil protein 2 [Danio rerio]
MAANDAELHDSFSGKSQPGENRKASRSSKHCSRSRSRSTERKRKSGDKRHKRSHSRSKEARKKDSEKALKCQSGSEERLEFSDKGRDRLSEDTEERHRRKDKKTSRPRSHSRSRSKEKRHHNRNWDKRRSRSRSRSRDKKRRARSRSNSRSKHRHRSRSRSKSREKKKRIEKSRKKSRSPSISPVTFRGRNTAMDAQEALARRLERAKKLQEQKEKDMLEKWQHQEKAAASTPQCDPAAAAPSPALNVAALLASGTQVTPQIAMAAQMAALQAKTLAETGIAVPSYYNPSAVNPMKFAEQEKKRKMLWQGKKEGDNKSQTAELWEKLNFGNKDQNVKFRKLMGIKGEEEAASSAAVNEDGLKTLQQQEEMFRNLDVQYEMARSQTHTQRGMGLGFSSSFSSRGMDAV